MAFAALVTGMAAIAVVACFAVVVSAAIVFRVLRGLRAISGLGWTVAIFKSCSSNGSGLCGIRWNSKGGLFTFLLHLLGNVTRHVNRVRLACRLLRLCRGALSHWLEFGMSRRRRVVRDVRIPLVREAWIGLFLLIGRCGDFGLHHTG